MHGDKDTFYPNIAASEHRTQNLTIPAAPTSSAILI